MWSPKLVSVAEAKNLPDLEGRVLDDRYQVGCVLGSGAMGAVFEATHVRILRRVAIKVMRPSFASREGFAARFMQEARAASLVRHPNVVEMLDFGEIDDGTVYSVMEFLEGEDLGALLKRETVLSWSRAKPMLQQIAAALHAAHVNGVIHRDIKPGNCFVVSAGDGELERIKVVDFGIAKLDDTLIDGDHALTATGEVLGTPTYMAPELVRGHLANPLTDIYALGVLAYRMLTGHIPFEGRTAMEVLYQHTSVEPEPLSRWRDDIPPAVESLVLEMLAKVPERRPQGMNVVGLRIEGLRLHNKPTLLFGHSEPKAHQVTPTRGQTIPSNPSSRSPVGITPSPLVQDPAPVENTPQDRPRIGFVVMSGLLGLAIVFGWLGYIGWNARMKIDSNDDAPLVSSHEEQPRIVAENPATAVAKTTLEPAPILEPEPIDESANQSRAPEKARPSPPRPRMRGSSAGSSRPVATSPSSRPEPQDLPAIEEPDRDAQVDDLLRPAMSALQSGRRTAAASLFEDTLKIDASNREALEGLADLYFDQGRYKRSAGYARTLARLDPSEPAHRLKLGDAHFAAKQYEDALRAYEFARDLGSSRASARIDTTLSALQ